VTYPQVDSGFLNSLEWRSIGPHRGGRVVAVAGHPFDQLLFYLGACSGGVWKTTDGGNYWENISDGFFKTSPVGAIAVSESDPNIIYVGMGESCIRGNVASGDGVYKSTDGGQTWAHMGLEDTRHISRIRVHPSDPNVVYVAALGHAFGYNQDRGIFRSMDGGNNWERVLFRDEKTGAIDLSMDANNPRVLYAALWQALREPWHLNSGGPGSGLFKSDDGGNTWSELSTNPGMPKGPFGRIGIAASPAREGLVYAIVEAEDGGLFWSDDGGSTWEIGNDERKVRTRPWYFNHIFADPNDPYTIYIMNMIAWKSVDGGRTFFDLTTPHGDNHDLWIDPQNSQRMVNGNDGGATVSFNGGATWTTLWNQPTAQFYHVAVDNQFPYRVYGTQQDNTAMSVPSSSFKGAIPYNDCYPVAHSESGHIAVRPDDHNIVYSGAQRGAIHRYDHRNHQVRVISIWPEVDSGLGALNHKYRFQWTFPIVISPHNYDVIYACGNHVFKSSDEGTNWEVISPDLTRDDKSKQGPSGGSITKDDTGAEHYCTIFAFAESPLTAGLLWVGTDDGLVQVSHDGGANWEDVTPKGMPEWTLVSTIEASPHDPAVAYIAATRYKLDDNRPFVFRTSNYGKDWDLIIDGIPDEEFTRVIREDPERRGLLYLGTEYGMFVSFDDGNLWLSMQNNLPVVPIHDLVVKDNDLVAATHGRSFWILDNLTHLHQIRDDVTDSKIHLFSPRDTYRYLTTTGYDLPPGAGKNYVWPSTVGGVYVTYYHAKNSKGETYRKLLDAGYNPPEGVSVTYYLKENCKDKLTLSFFEESGSLIKSFSSIGDDNAPKLLSESGTNQFVWDMKYPDAHQMEGDITTKGAMAGPVAPPGRYKVELKVLGEVFSQPFEIKKDPRLTATVDELKEQFTFLIQIRDKVSETHDAINNIRSLKRQIIGWQQRASIVWDGNEDPRLDSVTTIGKEIQGELEDIEEHLIQSKAKAPMDSLNFPTRLNEKMAALPRVVANSDSAPTTQSYQVYASISERIDQQLVRLEKLKGTLIIEFNELVRKLELPSVVS